MGPEFFQTIMGRKFYESTMPRIAKALEGIASKLEQKGEKGMARQGVAWNKTKTKSVVLSKLKEFTITCKLPAFEGTETIANNFEVRGWFNQENSFLFGEFYTRSEAEEFLQQIHDMY